MPSRSKYTQDELLKAVHVAKSGSESVRKIASKYGIPRTTLRRAISRECGAELGRPPVFFEESLCELRLMCVLKARRNIDVRKFAYEIAVSRNLVFPASWKKTKCAGPDWLKSFLLRNSFIPHFLASKKNRAKPLLNVECVYCCRSFSRDIEFDFCEACGLKICSFCRRNEISWCPFTDESLIEN